MSKQILNEDIATIEYDNLIYSNDVPTLTSGVVVEQGQGVLERGTLLAKKEDGKMVIMSEDEQPADCILCDKVDTTNGDVNTVAYIQGHFNIDALKVKDSYEITKDDEDVLRTKNILLGKALG